jgi:hypothetical protein
MLRLQFGVDLIFALAIEQGPATGQVDSLFCMVI